jgi:AcrR family transcriptional regulator
MFCCVSARDASETQAIRRARLQAAMAQAVGNGGYANTPVGQTLFEHARRSCRARRDRADGVRAALAAVLEAASSAPEATCQAITDGSDAVEGRPFEAFARLLGGAGDAAVRTAVAAGVQRVVHEQLRAGRPEQLRALIDPISEWVLGYELAGAAVGPLLGSGGADGRATPAPQPMLELFGGDGEGSSPRGRIMRAVVELAAQDGYAALREPAILARAQVAAATFHELFANPQQAVLSVYDLATLRALGAALTSFQAASGWPAAIRASLLTLLELLAAAPEIARLVFVEIHAAGKTGQERIEARIEGFSALLDPGFEHALPPPPRLVAGMIAGGVWGVIEAHVARDEAGRLPALTPALSYLALAPFLGAEEAARAAVAPAGP